MYMNALDKSSVKIYGRKLLHIFLCRDEYYRRATKKRSMMTSVHFPSLLLVPFVRISCRIYGVNKTTFFNHLSLNSQNFSISGKFRFQLKILTHFRCRHTDMINTSVLKLRHANYLGLDSKQVSISSLPHFIK